MVSLPKNIAQVHGCFDDPPAPLNFSINSARLENGDNPKRVRSCPPQRDRERLDAFPASADPESAPHLQNQSCTVCQVVQKKLFEKFLFHFWRRALSPKKIRGQTLK
jgi:hypothetical protein